MFCEMKQRYQCHQGTVSDHVVMQRLSTFKGLGTYSTPKVMWTSFEAAYPGYNPDQYKISLAAYKTEYVTAAGGETPDLSAFAAYAGWQSYVFPVANKSDFHAALSLADVVIDETYFWSLALGESVDKAQVYEKYGSPDLPDLRVIRTDGSRSSMGSDWCVVVHV